MKNFFLGLIFTVVPIFLVIFGIWLFFQMQNLAGYAAAVAFTLSLIAISWSFLLMYVVGKGIRSIIEKEENAQ